MKIKTLGKKALALTVCLAVLLSCLIISGISASAATVWDGTTKTQPTDSNGDGVFEIGTAAEFAWLGSNGGDGKYILTADIYLNDMELSFDGNTPVLKKANGDVITDLSTLNKWEGTTSFSGTLDGNGHTVSGMFNNTKLAVGGGSVRGMFGRGANATIKNFRVVNTYFEGATYESVLFAYNTSGGAVTVDTCLVEKAYLSPNPDEIKNSNYPTTGFIAGYIQNSKLVVNDCLIVDSKINSNAERIGGVLGDAWLSGGITMNRTLNATANTTFGGNPSNPSAYAGTMEGVGNYAFTANKGQYCPEVAVVTEGLVKGNAAIVSVYGLGDKFYTTAGYPIQGIFLDPIDPAVNKKLGTAPFEGSGTEADPYLIKTADDLRNAIGTYGMDKYYKLTNDIYLNDVDKIDWATGKVDDGYDANVWFVSDLYTGQQYNGYAGRGAFGGTLDGDGYAVHGLYIPFSALSTSSGLVPVTANATIKNIAIKNSFMAGGHWTGGITGYSYANTTFDTVLVDETVTVVGYDVGNKYFIDGWVKQDNPDAAVSPFSGKVSGGVSYESECTGGIVGYVNGTGTVNNCAVYGTVRSIAEDEIFATTNPLTNGGAPVNVGAGSHINGIVGTGWSSNVTISDCVSLIPLHDAIGGGSTVSCTDSYAQAQVDNQVCCSLLDEAQMSGADALTNMPGLSPDVWTKTAGYPLQKIFTCLGVNHSDAHAWTDWTETTPPQCEQPGEETRECSVCGTTDTKPVNQTGHAPANDWTSDTNGHWHECGNNCGEKLDYAAHTFDQRVETPDYSAGSADCTKPAKFYFSCVCGAKGTDTFDSGTSMGHSPKTEWTHDDTNHWHECNNCDEKLDMAAHTYDQEVATDEYLDTPADCNNAAKYVKSCVCGAKGTEVFESGNANGHDPKTEWTHDDTNHWHDCNDCDEQLDKEAHTYDNEVAKDAYLAEGATSTAAAKYYKSCECGAKGTETFSYGDPLNPGDQGGEAPETGDTSNVMVWVITLILSMAALFALAVFSRKRTN